jgi:hypothetical protein
MRLIRILVGSKLNHRYGAVIDLMEEVSEVKHGMLLTLGLLGVQALAVPQAFAATNVLKAQWNVTAQGAHQYQYKGTGTKNTGSTLAFGPVTFWRVTPTGTRDLSETAPWTSAGPDQMIYGPKYSSFTAPNNTYNCQSHFDLINFQTGARTPVWSSIVDPDTSPWP